MTGTAAGRRALLHREAGRVLAGRPDADPAVVAAPRPARRRPAAGRDLAARRGGPRGRALRPRHGRGPARRVAGAASRTTTPGWPGRRCGSGAGATATPRRTWRPRPGPAPGAGRSAPGRRTSTGGSTTRCSTPTTAPSPPRTPTTRTRCLVACGPDPARTRRPRRGPRPAGRGDGVGHGRRPAGGGRLARCRPCAPQPAPTEAIELLRPAHAGRRQRRPHHGVPARAAVHRSRPGRPRAAPPRRSPASTGTAPRSNAATCPASPAAA